MRVLVVSPWFPGEDTPASGLFVQREADALRREHDVHVVHLDWQRRRPLPSVEGMGYSHVSLDRRSPLSYLRARMLVSRLARDTDIVHTHALTGLLPWLVGRPGPRPWIHSEHWSGITAPETLTRPERLSLVVLKPLLRRPNAVIAESNRLADGIRRAGRRDVEIVPCVVSPVQPVEPVDTGDIRLVGVGSLIPRKGPMIALSAVRALVDDGEDAYLTWVGEGPLRNEMLDTAARFGISDRLTLTGPLDDRGVGAELDAATMFLLPTEGDNFCVVAAEAIMHGRPIVSGYRTGAVDYADERLSRFVYEQTGSAYADAIRSLRAACSLPAHEISATVRDRFSADAVCEQLTKVYEAARTPSVRDSR